jgi:hypothetical protein
MGLYVKTPGQIPMRCQHFKYLSRHDPSPLQWAVGNLKADVVDTTFLKNTFSPYKHELLKTLNIYLEKINPLNTLAADKVVKCIGWYLNRYGRDNALPSWCYHDWIP